MVPEDHIALVKKSVNTSSIVLSYSCGAPESTLNQRFLVADSAEGEYKLYEDSENFHCTMGSNGSDVKLLRMDPSKYYKFAMTVNGKEWESEVLHVGD